MRDNLREKLKALVEEMAASPILALHGYAHAIAAILAESEPCGVQECKDLGKCACFREPRYTKVANGVWGSVEGKTHYQGDDCPGGHESKCGYCGAPCEACNEATEADLLAWEAEQDERETQPVLKLGHEFVAALDSLGRSGKSSAYFCWECGQPREAH